MTIVTVEGFDGAGKTTAITKLVNQLENAGIKCCVVSEPGSTANGEMFRSILKGNATLSPLQQFMLFIAAREEVYRRKVKPALEAGEVVITDRGNLSTYAYQIMDLPTKFLSREQYLSLCRTATTGLDPDVVMFLDTPFKVCLESIDTRGGRDAIESKPIETLRVIHNRMRYYTATVFPQAEIHMVDREAKTAISEVAKRIITMHNNLN